MVQRPTTFNGNTFRTSRYLYVTLRLSSNISEKVVSVFEGNHIKSDLGNHSSKSEAF